MGRFSLLVAEVPGVHAGGALMHSGGAASGHHDVVATHDRIRRSTCQCCEQSTVVEEPGHCCTVW